MTAAQTLLVLQFAPMLAAGVVALIADAFKRRGIAVAVAALGAGAGGAVALRAGWTTGVETVWESFLVGGAFSTLPGVIGVLGALALIGGWNAYGRRHNGGSLAALVAIAAFAAGLTACAIDLIALLLVLETTALAAYALVSASGSTRSAEAALKYFIQGAVATGLLVFGIAVLVALYTPSGSYIGLATGLTAAAGGASPAVLGVMLVVAAFAFKAGAAPFHSWAPDAYETAPAESAAFLAGPMKAAFLFAAALFVATTGPIGASVARPLGTLGSQILPVVGVLGVLSIVVGSLAALRQRSYVRMLGYAGIAQVGYALIAASAVGPVAVAIFSTTYAIAACGAFLAAAAVSSMHPEWDGTIEGLAGTGRRSPILAAGMCVLMVSLAGLPPLVGFWGKFQVLVAAVSTAGRFWVADMAGLGALYAVFAASVLAGSVVSLAYYGGVARALFARGDGAVGGGDPASSGVTIAIAFTVLALGVLPLLVGLAVPMAGFTLN